MNINYKIKKHPHSIYINDKALNYLLIISIFKKKIEFKLLEVIILLLKFN